MNFIQILRLLSILQVITLSQNSHVQQAKQRIRAEVRSAVGEWPAQHHQHHNHHHQQQHHHPHQQQHHNHHYQHQKSQQHWHHNQRVQRWPQQHRNRWSSRRKSFDRHHFSAWTAWTSCGGDCLRRRERVCRVKRHCGYTKQLEERKCEGCHPSHVWHATAPPVAPQTVHHTAPAIIINAPQNGPQLLPASTHAPTHQIHLPVLQEFERHVPPSLQQHVASMHEHHSNNKNNNDDDDDDFYVINTKPRYKKQRKPMLIEVDDYNELEVEQEDDEEQEEEEEVKTAYDWPAVATQLSPQYAGRVRAIHTRSHRDHDRRQNLRPPRRRHPQKGQTSRVTQRSLPHAVPTTNADEGIEGDIFQYEDFDFDPDTGGGIGDARASNVDEQYGDSYEDYVGDYRNASLLPPMPREKATPDALIPKHRRVYSKWSRWTKCSPKCTTRRYKKCRIKEQCGREVLREIAYCYTEGSFCQQWLQAQVQKTPPYDVQPVASARRRDTAEETLSNSIVSDYIMNGKGYRGPEYTPLKIKCGIAPRNNMRNNNNNRRNMYDMMKIIGGKAARKGEWPWQVAIFNRFKEAFCGGTLIAPQWVLTAAHCVRKVLYVRLGEHNLDHEDGSELQLRVLKSYKHPNFDKKTVDSDVALLRLPKAANATNWIGFSCLPRPYQPLPKNIDCTVIGWGKRRNRDVAGTSVLHQAEVPIIPMDNCRSVYHDYTITKNMFCAGHKRGRIDTCAGDSGGPLLCRDTTKPNHPWTIFGITSFGDGCAKRNKFGIYAKVPNYVDWVWSVINCNGNCKLQQRSYGN